MIQSKKKQDFIEIDLTGSQGNIYYLLGVAQTLSKGFGISFSEVKQNMCKSDYENAIQVFDSYFGDFVILYR